MKKSRGVKEKMEDGPYLDIPRSCVWLCKLCEPDWRPSPDDCASFPLFLIDTSAIVDLLPVFSSVFIVVQQDPLMKVQALFRFYRL
jgi:hypothetical protein